MQARQMLSRIRGTIKTRRTPFFEAVVCGGHAVHHRAPHSGANQAPQKMPELQCRIKGKRPLCLKNMP